MLVTGRRNDENVKTDNLFQLFISWREIVRLSVEDFRSETHIVGPPVSHDIFSVLSETIFTHIVLVSNENENERRALFIRMQSYCLF